jgi:transcriptional regulator with XRE-family HTH domain
MSTLDARGYDRAVGVLLRALRHSYRIKQEQLATRLGVDVATISRYERGERAMTIGTLLAIADIFHVPAEALLPPEHRLAAPNPAAAAVSPELTQGSVETDTDLEPMELGAINSILHVLRANPELIMPVMAAIEQHAAGE